MEKLEGSIANTTVGTGTPVRIRLEARFWHLGLRVSPAAYLSPELYLPTMWDLGSGCAPLLESTLLKSLLGFLCALLCPLKSICQKKKLTLNLSTGKI